MCLNYTPFILKHFFSNFICYFLIFCDIILFRVIFLRIIMSYKILVGLLILIVASIVLSGFMGDDPHITTIIK